MSTFRSWRWSALAITFSLIAPAARAEMITPDSIPNPPGTVSSMNGTLVSATNYVTNQYTGSGLKLDGTAITQLNGVHVWAPLGVAVSDSPPAGAIDYIKSVGGSFVSPGSLNPMTVSSLSLDIIGISGTPSLGIYGLNINQSLNIIPVLQSTPGPDGGQVWTFNGAGISGFWVSPSSPDNGAWGVSQVSFTPATAPEPSSLLLAGLGALGLAARAGRRRLRRLSEQWQNNRF